METTETLAMAADNPHFPAWLRTACKDGAAEIDRRFGIGAELLIARRERDELRADRDNLRVALKSIRVWFSPDTMIGKGMLKTVDAALGEA